MTPDDFDSHFPGELVEGLDGLPAYIPNPLPPDLELTPEIIALAVDVGNALGRLDGMARALPNPTLLIRSFVRREAQLSSYIENTFADYEVVADAASVDPTGLPEPVRETANAEAAITAGVCAVREQGRSVTLGLIRELHSILLTGVRGEQGRGRYRTMQVYIGDEALGPENARFVPPPPYRVADLMDDHERYLCADDRLPWPIKLALLHYHFETIHPFEDGNGRMGRLLILLGLCQHGLITVPVLNPSLYLEQNRRMYYDNLLAVSTRSAWGKWVEFFLRGLHVAAVSSEAKMNEVLTLQAEYHRMLRVRGRSATLLDIVDHLFINPSVTVQTVADLVNVTETAARNSLNRLVEEGVLRLIEGKPQRFRADTIIKVLNPIPTRR